MPEEEYVTQLLNDLDQQLPLIWGRGLISIFFGGGTPSLFSPQSIEKLLVGISSRLRFGPDIEITLEANPGTVDEARFKEFREAGINRLSLGIQSLQDEKLKRKHGNMPGKRDDINPEGIPNGNPEEYNDGAPVEEKSPRISNSL